MRTGTSIRLKKRDYRNKQRDERHPVATGHIPAAAVLPLTEDRKVEAQPLHGWLGIGRDCSNWMRKLVADYGFEEGEDYSPVLAKSSGGRPRKDYLLSLDAAKGIAMIGNTQRGKATRRYFIAAEKVD